jgi:twitching motility protein PilU
MIGAKYGADFTALLSLVAQKKGSDLFITVGMPPCIKLHGRIMPVSKNKLTEEDARQMVSSVMSPAQREEFARTNECQFAISAKDIARFRVSAFVERDNPGMVLRRIENDIPSIEFLNLPPVVKDLAMTKRGLVIFTGATGTGKSTSLAACLNHRNLNSTGHIISIEDPIEFVHQHAGCIITQREVGIDTESYEVALKNTLRQAPDVILIGEIRTRVVMDHAIAFAETGHLVLSTLHANNANQALDRIINFFPEERREQLMMDLSMNLKGIVAQQLIRRADGEGRRQVAVEVLLNTPLASDLILKGEVNKLKDLMRRSNEHGMITFDQALYKLYKEKKISYEDAILHADSANEVRLMIKLGSNIGFDRYARGMEDVEIVDDEGRMS